MLLVSVNDARSTCNHCTCPASSSLWVWLNCPRLYYSVHCTCTHVVYFSLSESSLYKEAVHRLRVVSVCGQWDLCAVANGEQRGSPVFDRNGTSHPKTVQCKTDGGQTKDQRRDVSVSTCWSRRAARHRWDFPSILLAYLRKKPCFT